METEMKAEDIAHINVLNWFTFNYPEYEDDIHHFANQRRCSVMEGRKLKRMGVKKGVSDLFLALPKNGKAGLWIELKVKGGRLEPEQKAFIEQKIKRGYAATVTWSEDEAKEVLKNYMD